MIKYSTIWLNNCYSLVSFSDVDWLPSILLFVILVDILPFYNPLENSLRQIDQGALGQTFDWGVSGSVIQKSQLSEIVAFFAALHYLLLTPFQSYQHSL